MMLSSLRFNTILQGITSCLGGALNFVHVLLLSIKSSYFYIAGLQSSSSAFFLDSSYAMGSSIATMANPENEQTAFSLCLMVILEALKTSCPSRSVH